MDAFLIIGALLVAALAFHEYRLKRLSDKARREGREAADYLATGAFLGLGASGLHDRPHDHAQQSDHGDTHGDMGGGMDGGMGGN